MCRNSIPGVPRKLLMRVLFPDVHGPTIPIRFLFALLLVSTELKIHPLSRIRFFFRVNNWRGISYNCVGVNSTGRRTIMRLIRSLS
jgi:hypothetical protein